MTGVQTCALPICNTKHKKMFFKTLSEMEPNTWKENVFPFKGFQLKFYYNILENHKSTPYITLKIGPQSTMSNNIKDLSVSSLLLIDFKVK